MRAGSILVVDVFILVIDVFDLVIGCAYRHTGLVAAGEAPPTRPPPIAAADCLRAGVLTCERARRPTTAASGVVSRARPRPVLASPNPKDPVEGRLHRMVCDVSEINCSDFPTHAAAQAWSKAHGGSPSNDVAGLDRNHDGEACTSLP